jgi:hypothetical protein
MGGIYWIGLAQDRSKWRALVNAVMSLRGHIKVLESSRVLHNWWPLHTVRSTITITCLY